MIVSLGGLFLARLLFVIFTLDRGFDITDEGMIVNMLGMSEYYTDTFYQNYAFIGKVIEIFTPVSIISLRSIKVVGDIVALALLCFGIASFLQHKGGEVDWKLLFLFGGLGIFTTVFTRTLGYNELTGIITMLSLGCYFLSYGKSKWLEYSLLIFSGGLVWWQLLIKFPAAFFLIGIFVLSVLLKQTKWANLASIGIGVITGFVNSFLSGAGMDILSDTISSNSPHMELLGVTPAIILSKSYWAVDILENGPYWLVPLAFFIMATSFLSSETGKYIPLTLSVVIFCLLLLLLPFGWPGEVRFRWIALLLIMAAIAIYFNLKERGPSHGTYSLLAITLFFFPISCAFGSNNPLTITTVAYTAPWFVLIALAVSNLETKTGLLITYTAGLLGLLLFLNFYVLHPHQQPSSLLEQTENIQLEENISVDIASAVFLQSVYQDLQKNNFQQGDPIVALYDMPGVVYLVGGRSPRTIWYFNPSEGLSEERIVNFNCYFLNDVQKDLNGDAPYFLLNHNMPEGLLSCLTEKLPIWQTGSTLVNTYFNPYSQDSISLYAPK